MTKHKQNLREAAKFFAGLVTGDFLVGVWFALGKMIPFTFAGITFTAPMVAFWMVFDLLVIVLLVHYAWHAEVHNPTMRQRNFFMAAGVIFSVVAAAHLLRALFGVALNIGTWSFPFWLSWVAVIAAAFLAYTSFVFAARGR